MWRLYVQNGAVLVKGTLISKVTLATKGKREKMDLCWEKNLLRNDHKHVFYVCLLSGCPTPKNSKMGHNKTLKNNSLFFSNECNCFMIGNINISM